MEKLMMLIVNTIKEHFDDSHNPGAFLLLVYHLTLGVVAHSHLSEVIKEAEKNGVNLSEYPEKATEKSILLMADLIIHFLRYNEFLAIAEKRNFMFIEKVINKNCGCFICNLFDKLLKDENFKNLVISCRNIENMIQGIKNGGLN